MSAVLLCGLMVQCIGKIGTVHRITDRGDVRVQYDGANNRWTFHAGSLTKVKCDDVLCSLSSYTCLMLNTFRSTRNSMFSLNVLCPVLCVV